MTPRRVEIDVALGNIRSLPLMPPDHVREDMETLFDLVAHSQHAAVFGSEIIAAHGYRQAWHNAASTYQPGQLRGHAYLRTYGGFTEVPIATTEFGSEKTERLTRGVRKISPDRYATIVSRCLIDGFPVAFIASHNVNGTDNPRKFGATMVVRKALFALWRRRMRKHVEQLHRDGQTVIIGGDFNRHHPVTFHRDQVQILNVGLMQLAVIPAEGVTAKRVGASLLKRGHTDHPICGSVIALTAPTR